MAALQAAMGRVQQIPDDSRDEPVRDDITLAPPPDLRNDPPRPLVDAVRCPDGHPNPPNRSTCRLCSQPIDADQRPASIRQPVLATLRLPDGTAHAIDRQLVVGRRPDLAAGRAGEMAAPIVVGDETSVSRTHLRIDVEDWSFSVVDCGSRSGTALVVEHGTEPRLMDPWVPNELTIGSVLYLGGPTVVEIGPPGDQLGVSDE